MDHPEELARRRLEGRLADEDLRRDAHDPVGIADLGERLKTIGDAYMAAAGLPQPREDHAQALADFALAMRDSLAEYRETNDVDLRMRIGINSGPVVAGVIGKRRFLYDLWGDSVNTASRMESHGIPGEIQVTEATRDLLDGQFTFIDRGVIDIKGKGPMQTYLLQPNGHA